jgi:hypothetical protein
MNVMRHLMSHVISLIHPPLSFQMIDVCKLSFAVPAFSPHFEIFPYSVNIAHRHASSYAKFARPVSHISPNSQGMTVMSHFLSHVIGLSYP